MFKVPEKYRDADFAYSDVSYGNNGAFTIPVLINKKKRTLRVVASDGGGWEHVSVSLPERCPTWAEMCFVKDLFWSGNACVVQYHPPSDDYVNNHQYCLHLWRDMKAAFARPPSMMVGIK